VGILVTGGAGYIGSHTIVELLESGYEVIAIDNFSNSNPESLKQVSEITSRSVKVYNMNILDKDGLEKVFSENNIHAVIHFAGYKAVGESVAKPLQYYHNNISGTVVLLETMQKYKVKSLVFSSSATVYGFPKTVPISEDFPLRATNPYGRSKLMIEEILGDLFIADHEWSISILRYFNPIGAHPSGKIGENQKGIPNNLIPYISKVAAGELNELTIFGADYPTNDGTGVRDYVHVVDLAIGHLRALDKNLSATGINTYNLGTGNGYSVLEMVKAFEKTCGRRISYKIAARRPGDVAISYASPLKAEMELNWSATRGIDEMCADSWRWQSGNRNGYEEDSVTLDSGNPSSFKRNWDILLGKVE
jgi:UDP-glucose 4-epimerase